MTVAPGRQRSFLAGKVRLGIAARIALGAIILGAVATASVSFFMYRGSVDILVGRQQEALANSVSLAATRIATRFDTAQRDVVFLERTPPVTGLLRAMANNGVDPVDGSTMPMLVDRLAQLLTALVEARPGYFEARLLNGDGFEVVRVDRDLNGVVTRRAAPMLADRSSRPYFAETAKLPAGSTYVSDIDLNREADPAAPAARPAARMARPLFDATGRFVGALVLNLDLKSLFDVVAQTLGPDKQYFITNQSGDYLVNAFAGGAAFGFEAGKTLRLQNDFPGFAPLFDGRVDDTVEAAVEHDGSRYLGYGQRIGFDPATSKRFLAVAALASSSDLLSRTQALRDRTALLALLVIAIGVVLAFLFSRMIVRPLRTMTVAASHIAEGRRDVDVSTMTARHDETGELARAITAMLRDIAEREDRLTAQAAELTRSNQELAQFAYVASHDLQEPLRMVGSYLELLSRRYEGKLDDEAQEFIGFAVDGATRMKRLINDLLGYSRAGNSPLKREESDSGAIVSTVLAQLALQVDETNADVRVGQLPKVYVDPVQFGRVFQNLIENALKYRSQAAPIVKIAADRVDGAWRFSVTDNGIGVDPVFKEKIFEIFKRLHGRDRYAGTGIGLAVTKLVVERHGGRIWVEPATGGGSVFYFTLPDGRKD